MEMHRHTEVEWQFAAQDLDSTRQWLASQPQDPRERRFAARPTLDLRDTYYDSPDWMIFRAGYALRVRRARQAGQEGADEIEITLKALRHSRNGLARRVEVSEKIGDTALEEVLARDRGIGGRIRELVGSRALNPLFHARTRRERAHLLEADSELPLAEVDLDETSIEAPGGQGQELRRVEVECINAEPDVLSPLVEQLRGAAQLQPVELSKFGAGLAVAGLTPSVGQSLGEISIQARQPFAQAQLALLRRYFEAVLAREADLRVGSVSALHEMRVAARHLDVLLRVFRGYGPGWAAATRPQIRGLIKALGAVRDRDVQLAFLDDSLGSLSEDQRQAFAVMRERLAAQQAEARACLLRFLDSPGTQAWTSQWREHLQHATTGSARAQRAMTAVVARELIRDGMRKLHKRARRLHADSGPEEFHEVRIRAKRLRYTLDAFEGLYGSPAQAFMRALVKLQDLLGAFHDASVREHHFTQMAASSPPLPPATSFLVGRMVERDAAAVGRCRVRFPKAYRRVRKRRWRDLTIAMKREAQSASGTPVAGAPA